MILRVVKFFNGAVTLKEVMKEKAYFFNTLLEIYNEEISAKNAASDEALEQERKRRIQETIRKLRNGNG